MFLKINAPSVVYRTFPDEILIINLDSGDYFTAANVAAEIWQLIAAGVATGKIATEIAARWVGERAQIESEVAEFLSRLEAEGLVAAASAPGDAVELQLPTHATPADYRSPELQKYTDMQELLLLDPVHDVDESGWPNRRTDSTEPDLA